MALTITADDPGLTGTDPVGIDTDTVTINVAPGGVLVRGQRGSAWPTRMPPPASSG